MSKTIKSLFIASAFAFAGVASATNFGGNLNVGVDITGYTGNAGGYAESATVGGGQASGNVNHTGLSVMHTSNAGTGYAAAGGKVTQDGVISYTAGGSTSTNVSAGFTTGQAQGTTAGGAATDYTANAWGNFDTVGFGAQLNAGLGLGSFGNW